MTLQLRLPHEPRIARAAYQLPAQVERLAPREKEIATIVYSSGGATAKDIEGLLSRPVSNATIRTMLNRLVRKGIVKRRGIGRYRTFLYVPAISTEHVREMVLQELADEHFDGSLLLAASTLVDLLRRQTDAALSRRPARNRGSKRQSL